MKFSELKRVRASSPVGPPVASNHDQDNRFRESVKVIRGSMIVPGRSATGVTATVHTARLADRGEKCRANRRPLSLFTLPPSEGADRRSKIEGSCRYALSRKAVIRDTNKEPDSQFSPSTAKKKNSTRADVQASALQSNVLLQKKGRRGGAFMDEYPDTSGMTPPQLIEEGRAA